MGFDRAVRRKPDDQDHRDHEEHEGEEDESSSLVEGERTNGLWSEGSDEQDGRRSQAHKASDVHDQLPCADIAEAEGRSSRGIEGKRDGDADRYPGGSTLDRLHEGGEYGSPRTARL